MSLQPGDTLSSYKIVSLLGKGGMGEVYLARDDNLDRDVAIKVLPKTLISDEERIRRFEREAKLLASLQHPNIGAIYGFEGAGETRFLVLEYADGETLADRLARSALPLEDTLEICDQIAAALEAAHERGVVHRDLKPANVQLRTDGRVVVLDFGLARAMADETDPSGTSPVAESPTITAHLTSPGVVLGTAPYMSPEQARGKRVDKRADIWAFGCCLFEALTGQRAFHGDTVTDLFADIIKGEPDLSLLPKDTPWKVREVLERCLTKDPDQRLRDIGDARIELRRLSTDSGGLTAAAALTTAPARRRGARNAAWLGLGAILGAGLAIGLVSIAASPESSPPRRLSLLLSDEVPTDFLSSPQLTSDGSTMVFLAADQESGFEGRRWYVHDLEMGQTRPLDNIAEEVLFLQLAPDGSHVVFAADGLIRRAPLSGGPAVTIAPCPDDGCSGLGFDGAGGLILATEPRGSLYAIRHGETEPRLLFESEQDSMVQQPVALPNNRGVLFTLGNRLSPSSQAIGCWPTGGTEIVRLIEQAASPTYLDDGTLLYVRDNALVSARFDLGTLQLAPERSRRIEGIEVGLLGACYAVARDEGTVVYRPGGNFDLQDFLSTTLSMRWIGTASLELPELPPHIDFDLSPNERWLAISTLTAQQSVDGGQPKTEILVYDLTQPSAPLRRLSEGDLQIALCFSPDSRQLAYASIGDSPTLYALAVDRRHADPKPLLERPGEQFPSSWSPDSKTLYFTEGGGDIYSVGLEGDTEPVLESPARERTPQMSPDGKWLAFMGNLDGQAADDLYVERFPPTGQATRVTTEGPAGIVWDRRTDALRLYTWSQDADEPPRAFAFVEVDGALTWSSERLELPEPKAIRRLVPTASGSLLYLTSNANEQFAFPQSRLAGDHFVRVSGALVQ